ncbi:DUF1353 domain-containing protein [Parasphingorhabdus cellanae]|uniref:DUF1353 domain-containing protein n=1 Tax=Parasphingorhabdus cellanae TaxID=2806553 RepID=A0ABX7T5Y8_9SPHN|nr:DUF1353 domain-containing protein [Parasphingorhabdus cellanae]QTD56941.1 DUF1353 domain-containing protein [Parasphingorhabdus cellanae]
MAHYTGRPRFEWDEDGRIMTLLNRFAFVDKAQRVWSVPANVRVDGASIPKFAWSILGSPFVGRYRKASVVHDWYCDIRTREWKATHRMFYEAMRASKVSGAKARIMYAAVYYAGPRWDIVADYDGALAETVSAEAYSLEQSAVAKTEHLERPNVIIWQRQEVDEEAFLQMCDDFAKRCATIADVEAMIEDHMGATE